MRAPEIRFKQYKEKWGSIVLKEIGQTYSGLTGKVKEDFGIGNGLYIPFLNVLVNPQIDISNLQKVKIRFDEKQNKVHKGDILFNTSSETPEEVGLCSVFTSDIENVYLNSFCFGFRLTNSLINSSYIVYLLRSSLGRELMMILAQGATRYNLSKKSFLDSQIRIPESLQEQQKIAFYFQKLDSLIQTISKKLASLKRIKAASLQSMFPQEGETVPKVRFKGFEGEWKKVPFRSLVTFYRGLTYTPSNIRQKGTRVLRSSNINDGFLELSDNDVFVESTCVNVIYAKKGDILITSANGSPKLVGKHAIIDKQDNSPMVAGGFMLLAKSNESEFINISMNSSWYEKFLRTGISGGNGSIGNLNKTYLEDYVIHIPSTKTERDKLASFFTNLDKQIILQTQCLEKLKQIKAACLDKMFV